ncbi:MAG: M1 family metallopeptidase [Bacteroidales bacterium]|nr:M1 family metallopeptidase [Bacteroidales bacterium]
MLQQLIAFMVICTFQVSILFAQGHEERFNAIDVLHYTFQVELNDENDQVKGQAAVQVSFKKPLDKFPLDLKSKNKDGLGMVVSKVLEDGSPVDFDHSEDKLTIKPKVTSTGEKRTYIIEYMGEPQDGMIIGQNKYHDRTFFADHWPDRAHNWLPCVDHPSDKAIIEFIVTAPSHYDIIASGYLVGEEVNKGMKTAHWKTKVPLPTKISVIGIADFEIVDLGNFNGVPLSAWVYPQEAQYAKDAYSITKDVLEYYSMMVGPYPCEKLANVQSKTIYGGTENAGNIFYNENLVVRNGRPVYEQHEDVVVHELAHQWFGNSVSESNWYHVWISEGFATYFTDLFIEHMYGVDSLNKRLISERRRVIGYTNNRRYAPVVDTTPRAPQYLLSALTYQKGAWFLHMLRHKIGDELFWQSIQKYYDTYKLSNVLTEDFQEIVEQVSEMMLDDFFKQWLYTAGHPVLSLDWKYDSGKISIDLGQHQPDYVFKFPIDIQVKFAGNPDLIETFYIDKRKQTIEIRSDLEPAEIIPDPEVRLLYEFKE